MPRSIAAPNGDLLRCGSCSALSIRLRGGRSVSGCECGFMREILGEVPDGVFVSCGEKVDGCFGEHFEAK